MNPSVLCKDQVCPQMAQEKNKPEKRGNSKQATVGCHPCLDIRFGRPCMQPNVPKKNSVLPVHVSLISVRSQQNFRGESELFCLSVKT